MLSEELSLELDGLTALQRKLLVDLVRCHPQFWSRFRSDEYGWAGAKKSLEGFLQNHSSEFLKELKRFGFSWEECKCLGSTAETHGTENAKTRT
jgi:hypothetical protein